MTWLLKRPSAFLPLIMSALLLLLIAAEFAQHRPGGRAAEGVAAHLFQILMPMQAAIIAFFAYSWLPRDRRRALRVLGLQCAAALAVLATVYLLRL